MYVRQWFALISIFIFTLTLTGCGGGGESPNSGAVDNSVSAKEIEFKAWFGNSGTELSFPAAAQGMDFYRSTSKNCDLDNYSLCPEGQLVPLTNLSTSDANTSALRNVWFWLRHNKTTSEPTQVALNQPDGRANHQVVAFKERL